MQYISTRGEAAGLSSARAILRGLAADGGLYLPETLPVFSAADLKALQDLPYSERAAFILSAFLTDYSAEELASYTAKAYASFSPILRTVDDRMTFLELYHGPTCAFKDFALQLLPYLLTGALRKTGESRTAVILTATSGDTGKAALDGFADVDGTRIAVFYPAGGTSRIQELQMTTQAGNNVAVFAVEGNFDDTQTGVKRIFSDAELAEALTAQGFFLSSANSINWGRLVPQIAYYVSAYVDMAASGRIDFGDPVNVTVPTGNFGNILAAYLAKCCGIPFARLICASNRNNVLTDFLRTGIYDANRPFYLTASPSMDILISSNLERLLYLLSGRDADRIRSWMDSLKTAGRYQATPELTARLAEGFFAGYAEDPQSFRTLQRIYQTYGYLMDTHTAVACDVYEQYYAQTQDPTPTLIASTASPFKFSGNVLKALEQPVPADEFAQLHALEAFSGLQAPAALAGLAGQTERFTGSIAKDAMKDAVKQWLQQ